MTYQEVNELVASFGLPYSYWQFQQDTRRAPPFLCFFFGSSDDMYADNRNFQRIRGLHLELYTDRKAFDLEEEIEGRLEALDIPYHKEETFLEKERMHMTSYDADLVITSDKEEDENA